ncbi:YggT family protein [Clostridium sp.]|uniref:YggT family protein n=1 Tax=Clostridium sp. TaxID=1506 RepID=UPI001A564024|nr:YggT family protein [Clostridium sp.]MBK5240663.1 YggT family protein [Clostridium sp.]
MKNSNLNKENIKTIKIKKIIYYILGILEVLFGFRLVFKILGANPGSAFVSSIYSITKLFLTPFSGIFKVVVSKGSEIQSVLEPPLIIAMIVYALLAWGIAKLIDIISNQKDTETL